MTLLGTHGRGETRGAVRHEGYGGWRARRFVVHGSIAGAGGDFAVLLPIPPAATQDAFRANDGSGQTRWQNRRNQHRLLECLLGRYAGRESEHVDVEPTHLNLDCVHNDPAVTEPANLRSSVQLRRLSNGVHRAAEGYRQDGDSLYAWLKAGGKSQSAAP